MKEEQWYANKKTTEGDYKEKMNKIVSKLNRAQKLVEEKQKKFQHDIELKNELRRLREHDLAMELERQKKLEEAKKDRIIAKEQKDSKAIKDR